MQTCSICGSGNLISGKEYFICQECGTLRTTYQYDPSVYDQRYAERYIQNLQTDTNIPLNLNRLGLISKWLRGRAKVLDIGCGSGEFLRFAERYYECYGVEPNEWAGSFARSRCFQSSIYSKLNGDLPQVHVVTLFDVLEHVEDPKRLLLLINKHHLLPGGIVVVTTPNIDAVKGRVEDWKHFKPKEHLWNFSLTGLSKLLEQTGFQVVHIDCVESQIRPGNPNGDILTVVGEKA